MIKKINALYFSATDRTKKTVNIFADELSQKLGLPIETYDFTLPRQRETFPEIKDALVVMATPTYAGRVPNLLLPFVEKFKAVDSVGVSIVTYGNRNFDDSLMELTKIMEPHCTVIGSGAFSCEHSFSTILGKGRPDEHDIKVIREFADKVAEKVRSKNLTAVTPKGEYPLRPYFTPQDRHGNKINFVKIKPLTDMSKCDDCKVCAEVCPLGSIDYDNVENVPGKCMKCCACVKKCHTGAKYFDDHGYIFHKEELEDIYSRRSEPEYFI